jgi:predicted nucleic acid-binding protein
MTTTVVLDADLLSSFLKIGRLDLVRTFYQVERALVPAAVYREIAQTDLLPLLVATTWLQVATVPIPEHLLAREDWASLGPGEQESIALALHRPDVVILMSDNRARQVARALGVTALNIPAFLLACKLAGLVSREELGQIVQALKDQDYYEFRADVRERLLQ